MVHIAGYKFLRWEELGRRKAELRRFCVDHDLRGTILLSQEGINLFVAGAEGSVDALLDYLRAIPGLEDFTVKRTAAERSPYSRMLVKVKREIITFGQSHIDPRTYTSPRLAPRELCQWLDEGRPVALLDVRNDYEVDLGTFRNAIRLPIEDFRHFPGAMKQVALPQETPVVTFCTGGIRCEKAGPFLESLGYQQVYQLEGGILNYFAECGGKHFDGECFVFDDRVALDATLRETSTVLCYACQMPLTAADQQSSLYRPGESCPHCYYSQEELLQQLLAKRHAQIRRLTDPLPGAKPYDNVRPIMVPKSGHEQRILDFLDQAYPFVGRDAWQGRLDGGWIRRGNLTMAADSVVYAGDRLLHTLPNTTEPDVNVDIRILHEEAGFVVVHKPAPLPMHPCGRYNRNTLIDILRNVYRPEKLRIAHRLDANTSGVVVLSRTARIASRLQPQFEEGQVQKRYLVRVHGEFPSEPVVCQSPIGTRLAAAGSRTIDQDGLAAETHFCKLHQFEDGTSLVEARPITGRTNQIRIHAWHLGFPVWGDPMYRCQHVICDRQTLLPSEPAMCLHAWSLSFLHPETRQPLSFEAAPPTWSVVDHLIT